MPSTVDVVIVNWNSSEPLRRCLASVQASRGSSFTLGRVIVVDNASADGCAHVTSCFPGVELIQNSRNLGFAAACNAGAKNSGADYLLFLNPDTAIAPDALAKVISFMDGRDAQGVGICGIQLVTEAGEPALCCSRFPTPASLLAEMTGLDRIAPAIFPSRTVPLDELDCSRVVDQVIGAFFTVRRKLFEALNGFDERFFVYFEEVDFSRRARNRGSDSYFLREARAIHTGGASSNQSKGPRLAYFVWSRLVYARKHFGRPGFAAVLLFSVLIEPVTRIGYAIFGRSQLNLSEVTQGYRRVYSALISFARRQAAGSEHA